MVQDMFQVDYNIEDAYLRLQAPSVSDKEVENAQVAVRKAKSQEKVLCIVTEACSTSETFCSGL